MTAAHHGRKGRPWRRIRLQILARDPFCQIRGPKCKRISTTVDHIIPLSVAPHLAHVLSNLRGACGPCNYGRGAQLTNSRRKQPQLPQREPQPYSSPRFVNTEQSRLKW